MCESMNKTEYKARASDERATYCEVHNPSKMRSVDSATVHRRQLELPREICPVSLRRLREPRGDLTAGQKSAEGVVDHVVGEASEALQY